MVKEIKDGGLKVIDFDCLNQTYGTGMELGNKVTQFLAQT